MYGQDGVRPVFTPPPDTTRNLEKIYGFTALKTLDIGQRQAATTETQSTKEVSPGPPCCCLSKLPGPGAGAGGAEGPCIKLICITGVLEQGGEDRKNISTVPGTPSVDENYKPTGPRSSTSPKHNSLKPVIMESLPSSQRKKAHYVQRHKDRVTADFSLEKV